MTTPSDDDLFEVVTYLVNSAPLTYDEPLTLNAFRLVDAASRLMRLTDDEFLRSTYEQYAANRNLAMADQDAFRAWLHDYARTFTAEALRRARAD